PLDNAAPNHAQRRHDAHIHDLRRRFQGYLAPLGPLAIAIDGNAVVIAERADPRLGPAVAATGRFSGAIEEPRDLLVGHQAFQLTGDQAIVGIDGVILPTGMRRREARLLQRQIELPLGRRRLARLSLERLRGGIDAQRLQDPKNLATDSIIDTHTTERDAPLRAVVHKSALAVIAPRLAPIAHVQ